MSIPTTQIKGHKTDIPGLIVFDVSRIEDDRGWFQERYHKAKLVQEGLPKEFNIVQNSISYNNIGTTRGFHAEPWGKYISVMNGSAFCAFVDLREGANFGTTVTTTIDPKMSIFIPSGVANAYQCLTDGQYYLYSVDAHWTVEAYEKYTFVNLGDPELAVEWPIRLNDAILSARDRTHPLLSEIRAGAQGAQ
jgi:dTDP-4-dehydrorhamnose 3,5-epimerase